ncbi:hypothetical protein V6N11_016397 [Hibiscus sabdariffa]|uniref:Origin recognition complex subunit 2 winged-helix domain-containing protein n=1 Tax=Hibiscus sabdariffa TaxID=183260 RepID=A0ABR2TVQ7_9ROSI
MRRFSIVDRKDSNVVDLVLINTTLASMLVWDKKMVHSQFNWCWYHVPTFLPYTVEGLFFPMILAHGSSNQSAKTAVIVLQSLTPNAQSVFRILAEYQLSHPDDEGMAIDNLYSMARERFLVSSQVTLNAHLTEFKDHELVKTRRHRDGQDCLYIPLAHEALEKLLSEIDFVQRLQAANLSVFFQTFSNEFTAQAWDFFSDATVEINSFYTGADINGVITDFPKTSNRYRTDVVEPPLPHVAAKTPTSTPSGTASAPRSPNRQPRVVASVIAPFMALLLAMYLLF